MTGVSSSPRASSSTRAPRRISLRQAAALLRAERAAVGVLGLRVLGAGLILATASGCASELADGNASSQNPGELPTFGMNGTGGNGGIVNPGGSNVTVGPNGEAIPPVVNSQANRNPTLGVVDLGVTVDATGAPVPVTELAALEQCATPGPRLIRRLTSEQYRNTLVSAFGSTDVPDAPVLRDATTLGYNVDADDSVIEGLDAGALMTLGESVAEWALGANKVGELSNNCSNLNDQNCRQTFVRNLGERISREPLDQERVGRFTALFDADGVESFNDGAALVITAMVQSPYLLYRRELGPLDRNQTEFSLTPLEIASELSYFLTNGPPDTELMDAAKNGRLTSREDIDREAQRLMALPVAQSVFARFVRAWTDIDRLVQKAKSGAEFPAELRADMIEETERFFDDVLGNGGTIGDLFGAPFTYMNQRLANFYGGMEGVTSPDFTRIDISDGSRVPGLLGQGSYLTAHALADNSSPVQRAFVVRERFLCNDLPEVPTDLDTNLDAPVATDTSRERYARHSTEEPCRSCHQLMDPIGFTFENFDGFGRYRETEAGKPVDSSGGVPIMNGSQIPNPLFLYPLEGIDGLADYLSQIEDVRACFINNLSYFGYGLANETKWPSSQKRCTDNSIRQEARDSGNTIQSVVDAILHAPHFTRRVRDI
jgi:hypothetical protein